MTSRYPVQIDSSLTLPTVTDNFTLVTGSIVNQLREAIINVQSELGIKPSGINGTVRARLDQYDVILSAFGDLTVAGGDLYGNYPNPSVIKIQGYPVSNLSPSDGYVLTWNNIDGYWKPAPSSGGGGVPGGADTQIQFNDSGSFGGDAGLTYSKVTNILSLSDGIAIGAGTKSSTGYIRIPHSASVKTPIITALYSDGITDKNFLQYGAGDAWELGNIAQNLYINGFSLQLVSYATAMSVYVNSGFSIYDYAIGNYTFRTSAGGIQLGSTTDLGGGTGVIGITDASVVPTTNPTGGVILYSEGGALKFRDPSGTVTTIGSGGSGTPGGSDTQVQFNDAGSFGGDAGLTYDKTNNILEISGALSLGTSAATTGNIRVGGSVATNQMVWNDGTADRTIIKTETGGNGVEFGTSAQPGNYYGSSVTVASISGPLYLYGNSNQLARLSGDTSDFIRLGSPSATAGEIRLPGDASIKSRDAGDTVDWNVLTVTGGTTITLGDATYGSNTSINGASVFLYGTANAGIYNTNGSGYALYVSSADMTIGTTYTLQNGNPDGSVVDVIRSVATTDATVTNLYTWTITNNAVTLIDIAITACDDTASTGGSWKRSYTIRTAAGTVTAIGTVHDVQTDEDAAGWDVTIDDDGAGLGRVRVTGAVATNITWYGAVRLQVTPM